jgi:stage II sporulation protein D
MNVQIRFFVHRIPMLLLIPYLSVIALQGHSIALGNRSPDVETYLPMILCQEIEDTQEIENIKAQAIIARSNFYRRLSEGENFYAILKQESDTLQENGNAWKVPSSVYEEAVRETKGLILTWNQELVLIPYHEISGGKTREGEEAFHDSAYTYLKSVDSSVDQNAEKYQTTIEVSKSLLPEDLEIEEKDEAGYVVSLRAGETVLDGEAFCQGMKLPSADFVIQKTADKYQFICYGKGHGLGFSQYGGNEMAKEGSSCTEILETYFPELEITEIES